MKLINLKHDIGVKLFQILKQLGNLLKISLLIKGFICIFTGINCNENLKDDVFKIYKIC